MNSSIPTISDVEKFASDAKEGFEGIKEVFTGMSDKDISTLKKIGIETFMTCFGELVPGGKFGNVINLLFNGKPVPIDKKTDNSLMNYFAFGETDRFTCKSFDSGSKC